MSNTSPQLDPSSILQTAFGFCSSKVLLTAVEFDVFTKLGIRRVTGAELGAELSLHPRAISDFFDALVAMKFLNRDGDGPAAKLFISGILDVLATVATGVVIAYFYRNEG